MVADCESSTVVEQSPHHPKVEGSSQAVAAAANGRGEMAKSQMSI
jgi:hypothetical protein